jgi:hypothetical protein
MWRDTRGSGTLQQCEGGGDEGGRRDRARSSAATLVLSSIWRNRPLATVYFTVDKGCPYNSVKMLVVFAVRGIRLSADIQTQRSCRR